MALTRAQLLMGNVSDGAILSGQSQGVRPGGTGIDIALDGIISVDSQSIVGVMKLGQTAGSAAAAYNGYTWPSGPGTAGQQLESNGAGLLSWADADGIDWTLKGQLIVGTGVGTDILLDAGANDFVLVPDSTTASGLKWRTAVGVAVAYTQTGTPTSPVNGQLWYDCSTGTFKVYQTCVTPSGWTNTAQSGLQVLPANTSAAPPFTNAGSPTGGTVGDPWLCTVSTVGSGGSIFVVNTVTVTGLAPFQFVPIVDLDAITNGGRFSFSNNYADSLGNLVFQTIFNDRPSSVAGTSYTANVKVGYNSAYVNATVNMVATLAVTGGAVTGPAYSGQLLTYTPGTAIGGVGPYTYTYQWYADGVAIPSATGLTYTVTPGVVGKFITAATKAVDAIAQTATGISNAVGPILTNPGALTVTSAGSITPNTGVGIGVILTYSPGTYTAGIPPVTTSWVWERSGVVIPGTANATTYTTVLADGGLPLTVTFTATDSSTPVAATSSLTTAAVTPSAEFPTAVWNPGPANGLDTIPGGISGPYTGTGTTVTPSGCLEVSVNGGPYSASATPITSGQTLAVRWRTTPSCGGAASGTLLTGAITDGTYTNTYTVTVDRVPTPFSFNTLTGVGLSSVEQSNSVTISGINIDAYLTYDPSSTGNSATFQASLNGGTTWTNIPASGTSFPVPLGSNLLVRQTSSNAISTTTTLVANIGDGDNGPNTSSSTFTVTTTSSPVFPTAVWNPGPSNGMDTIPGGISGVYSGTGNTITPGGCIEVSVNGGGYSTSPTAIIPGQTLAIRWSTSPSCGGAPSSTAITGTVSDGTYTNTYNVTIDRVPSAFLFNTVNNAPLSTVETSVSATIGGTNCTAYLTYDAASTGSAGTFQGSLDGGGTWTNIPASGTSFPVPLSATTLLVRQTSAGTISTTSTLIANIGDGDNGPNTTSATFTVVTTSSPTFPNLPPSLVAGPTSIPGTVSGTWADGAQTNLTSTGCLQISLDGSSWGQGPLTIGNGGTLYERWDPTGGSCGDAPDGTTITGTLTNGTLTDTYSLLLDRDPSAFTLTAQTNVGTSAVITSNTVTLSGSNAPCYITYTNGSPDTLTSLSVSINSAGYVSVPSSGTTLSAPPGATLTFQGTTGGSLNTDYTITVNYGSNSTGWSVTTVASVPPGSNFFTSPGTWTAPPGLSVVYVSMIGGGGGGAGGVLDGYTGGGGGGGGQVYTQPSSVSGGSSYPVTVGSGGSGGGAAGGTGNPGGSSSFNGITVSGGNGTSSDSGGSGGSPSGNPGGAGINNPPSSDWPGGGGGGGGNSVLTGYGGGGGGGPTTFAGGGLPGSGGGGGAVSITW